MKYDEAAAVMADYTDFRQYPSLGVARITLEMPIERANEYMNKLGGLPSPKQANPVLLVRLDADHARMPTRLSPPKRQPLSQQAGALCAEGRFRRFLETLMGQEIDNSEDAAVAVRRITEVSSRREFDDSNAAARAWQDLKGQYDAWLLTG